MAKFCMIFQSYREFVLDFDMEEICYGTEEGESE
jgi:hypothetical protein